MTLDDLAKLMETGFTEMMGRLDKVEGHLDRVENRLGRLETVALDIRRRLRVMEIRMSGQDGRLDDLEVRMDRHDGVPA